MNQLKEQPEKKLVEGFAVEQIAPIKQQVLYGSSQGRLLKQVVS